MRVIAIESIKDGVCRSYGEGEYIWDKAKGIKIAGKPWAGIKSKTVRTCTVCGKKEYWTNDGMFCGWFSTP